MKYGSATILCNIITCLCIFAMAYICYLYIRKENDKVHSKLPNLVSTIGVLGTFLGICITLYIFNAQEIDTSVPKLLEGMKTAFITSAVGMLVSLGMKAYQWKLENNSNEEEHIEDGVELFNRMIGEMKNLNTTLVSNQDQINNIIITTDKKRSEQQIELINEIKGLKIGVDTKQDVLIEEFRSFAQTMAEQNSKSLVEALREVIKDFNTKITEQFGDNFKELNKAVGALLQWQENYKEQIELSTSQLKITTASMVEIERSIGEISNDSQVLIDSSKGLNTTLDSINNNQKEITDNMKVLAEISQNAKELIPNVNDYFEVTNKSINDLLLNVDGTISESMTKLEAHIQELTVDVGQGIHNSFEEMKENFQSGNDLLKNQIRSYLESFNEIVNELNNCVPEINEHLESSTERFNATLSKFKDEIGKSMERNLSVLESQSKTTEETTIKISERLEITTNDLNSRIEEITINTSEQIKKLVEETEKVFEQKVEQLDKLLEQELTNSLTSLGTQLATISERFVEDYTPLTEKLREVVHLARRVSA